MKEIKFCGKRLDNGEWVYGCLTRYSEHMSYITVDLIENEVHEVLTATVGQFINLRDNHNCGNEIYKGGIVRVTQACGEEYIGKVVWDEDRLAWAVDSNDLDELVEFANILHGEHLVEVIGNKWDHPHLLELNNAT